MTEAFFHRSSWSNHPPAELIGPSDPTQVPLALERVGDQLPRRVRTRLSRLLRTNGSPPRQGLGGSTAVGGHVVAPWLARSTLVQRVFGRQASSSLWARLQAHRDANAAGPWWPSRTAVVVSERPQVVNSQLLESPTGPRRRLHAADGAAVIWGDGITGHVVEGVHVPADLLRPGWTIERILAERNVEVRRLAMERFGWDRLVAEAGLTPVHGPVPDPGNPGRTLSLVELPSSSAVGGRFLLCTNASADRDGSIRRFGLLVPATIDNAVAAAAWTFDVDRRTYEGLDRAT